MSEVEKTMMELHNEIDELKNLLKIMSLRLVSYNKKCQKKITSLEKKLNKKKRNNPSGFANPTDISDDLCSFMNMPLGSKVPRTEVTKYIINYIKEHNLQDEKEKSKICLDDNLTKLLGDNENVTYFSLQSLMNKHFIKYKNNELSME